MLAAAFATVLRGLTAVAAAPASTPAPAAAPAQAADPAAIEVVVRGLSASERLRRQAHAVEVVELATSARRAADLGEVMARQSSLRVQREGGLGSQGRYGLGGLSGDRVRFFIEGVPLEYSAYQLGIGNVPLNLLDRVEVYQGVVPARFGADALGGAINLAADERPRSDLLAASYQLGSFGTHRAAVGARQHHVPRGLFVRAAGFFDSAANDYPIDVEVTDASGRLSAARVRRFHDGFRGLGGTLTAGVVNRPWARRLALELFAARYQREVQHNPLASVPYGEVDYRRAAAGSNLRYQLEVGRARLDAVVGYARRRTGLRDEAHCRYDWYGRCAVTLPLGGEIDQAATDRQIDEDVGFARVELAYAPGARHTLRLAAAPTLVRRRGRDAVIPDPRNDPLTERRHATTNVIGLEHELTLGPLASILVVKGYQQAATDQLRVPSGGLLQLATDSWLAGGGWSTRLVLASRFYLKASYEYAARLPGGDERFGDGGLVRENLQLLPERSHNVAVGLVLDDVDTRLGHVRARLSGIGRRVDNLIVLMGTGNDLRHDNVLAARVLALDAGLGWSERRDRVGAEASVGFEDARNDATTGPAARFRGDRVPNLPYLQAAASAYLRAHGLATPLDHLELYWDVRHVRAFQRGWQSAGSVGVKLEVPAQTQHAAGLTYVHRRAPRGARFSAGLELRNLSDARAYDFFGAQRPGRSVHLKLTATRD